MDCTIVHHFFGPMSQVLFSTYVNLWLYFLNYAYLEIWPSVLYFCSPSSCEYVWPLGSDVKACTFFFIFLKVLTKRIKASRKTKLTNIPLLPLSCGYDRTVSLLFTSQEPNHWPLSNKYMLECQFITWTEQPCTLLVHRGVSLRRNLLNS